MQIVTYNINSVRSRVKTLNELIQNSKPEIVGLQEIKVQTDHFPHSEFEKLNYDILVHGQKSYHGVALFSKTKPQHTQVGLNFEEDQARTQYACYNTDKGKLHLVNCYFPQGESRSHKVKFPYKQRFYQAILDWLKTNFNPQNDKIILMGDFNIAPTDYDIGIGEQNKKRWLQTGKCSFLPEEREMLNQMLNWGLSDPYRRLYPNSNEFFSWFDYRSRGFESEPKRGLRIDFALCSKSLEILCKSVSINYQIRGAISPSDHAPVHYTFDLTLR